MEFRNNGYHPQWIHSLSGGHQIGAIQTPNGDQFSAHTNELYNVQPSCVESPSRLGIQVRNLAYTHRSKGTGLDSLESLFKPSKKSRGSKDILSDVNINIQRGSIYGLLGPSGECKLKRLEKPKQPTDARKLTSAFPPHRLRQDHFAPLHRGLPADHQRRNLDLRMEAEHKALGHSRKEDWIHATNSVSFLLRFFRSQHTHKRSPINKSTVP